jgi:hypothetical protein
LLLIILTIFFGPNKYILSFCSLFGFSFGSRITPNSRIDNEAFVSLISNGARQPVLVMELQEIRDIYSTFSKYKLGNPVTGHYCSVCLSEEDNIYFQTTPLHLIPPFMLSKYFSSIGIMEGNGNDFKYFIPRILEIMYHDEDDGSWFFDQIWNRLTEAKYTSWHNGEVESINRLFAAYLKKYIRSRDKRKFELTRDILKDVGYGEASRFVYTD